MYTIKKEYRKNGNLSIIRYFFNNKLIERKIFHPSKGYLRYYNKFKNNKKHGKQFEYYLEDDLTHKFCYIENYKNGLMHGDQYFDYPFNNSIDFYKCYNGKIEGIEIKSHEFKN